MTGSRVTGTLTGPAHRGDDARPDGRELGRAVITGLGITAPTGLGRAAYWDATLAGASGLRPLDRFDGRPHRLHVAGQIDGLDVDLPGRLLSQTDRSTQLALLATADALGDAGMDTGHVQDYAMGVAVSTAAGGFEFGQRELQKLWGQGRQHVSGYQSFAWFYAVQTGQISIRHGMRGASTALVSEQAGGLDSLGYAARRLADGATVMTAGGIDAPLCPWAITALAAGGQFSTRRDPNRAYLPFDPDADGFVPGEGGAILVLEDADTARARGARVYAEFGGWASTFDGAAEAPGAGLRRAAEQALAAAGATTVDVVFADAAGVPRLDAAEAAAISGLVGRSAVPVTAPKAGVGRLYAGGSALDAATAAIALHAQRIPPTPNCSGRHDSLDLVDTPRSTALRTALVLSRGRGGFNSALVLHHSPQTGARS